VGPSLHDRESSQRARHTAGEAGGREAGEAREGQTRSGQDPRGGHLDELSR